MPASQIPNDPPRFAILGGGITGLVAAHRLTKRVPHARVELFEASDRLGGVLDTRCLDGLLLERGADSFLTKLSSVTDLCQELGLGDELIPTNEQYRRALVLRAGRLYAVPEGFLLMRPQRLATVLRSPLLSWRGKLRLCLEPWMGHPENLHQANYDESVASFAIRRLGRETLERLVQPLLAGIYTADPYQLSLAATMPEALEAERKHGSLRRAACRALQRNGGRAGDSDAQASGARYSSFVTLRNGLASLIHALADHLPAANIHLNCRIESLVRGEGDQWRITAANGSTHGPFQAVVVALPAPRAAQLLEGVDPSLGDLLGRIPYASSAVVSMVFRRDQIAHPLDGFGFVVPTVEKRPIVAASFSSVKFPGRAPDDQVLVRVFLGGALQPEMVDLADSKLQEIALTELRQVLGLRGDPRLIDLARWRQKMPQYHVGHLQLVDAIQRLADQQPGLALAGNAYRGVGIPQCVQSGEAAAKKLALLWESGQRSARKHFSD